MTAQVVALVGWLSAGIAAWLGVGAWRSKLMTLEAVARVAHELRGPLTAARLGLELGARTAELSPAHLRAIDHELEQAALALDDLQGVGGRSRRDAAGTLVEIGELLGDAVEGARAAASARGAELALCSSADVGQVLGERVRLAQAVRNLIANAIEHGRGRIEVSGHACGGFVRIEVLDGGPGLPAPVALLARLPRAGHGARGRGLAIACAVAEDHGGRLAAAPSATGARLVLELPLAGAAPGDRASGA